MEKEFDNASDGSRSSMSSYVELYVSEEDDDKSEEMKPDSRGNDNQKAEVEDVKPVANEEMEVCESINNKSVGSQEMINSTPAIEEGKKINCDIKKKECNTEIDSKDISEDAAEEFSENKILEERPVITDFLENDSKYKICEMEVKEMSMDNKEDAKVVGLDKVCKPEEPLLNLRNEEHKIFSQIKCEKALKTQSSSIPLEPSMLKRFPLFSSFMESSIDDILFSNSLLPLNGKAAIHPLSPFLGLQSDTLNKPPNNQNPWFSILTRTSCDESISASSQPSGNSTYQASPSSPCLSHHPSSQSLSIPDFNLNFNRSPQASMPTPSTTPEPANQDCAAAISRDSHSPSFAKHLQMEKTAQEYDHPLPISFDTEWNIMDQDQEVSKMVDNASEQEPADFSDIAPRVDMGDFREVEN